MLVSVDQYNRYRRFYWCHSTTDIADGISLCQRFQPIGVGTNPRCYGILFTTGPASSADIYRGSSRGID